MPAMVKKRIDFEIVPIFDQSKQGIWSDFIDIEAICDKELYDTDLPTEYVRKHRMRDLKSNLLEYKYNFAFAAYFQQRMIGFTHGYSEYPNAVYLRGLYVLPKYQYRGIGTQLLFAVEQTSGMVADKIQLVALENAVDFYEKKNGYQHFSYMTKYLSPIPNSVVPVFGWVKKDFNLKINVKADSMLLKQNKYQPIFVHTNADCKIDGVAVRTKEGINKIWTDVYQNKCRYELLNALNKVK